MNITYNRLGSWILLILGGGTLLDTPEFDFEYPILNKLYVVLRDNMYTSLIFYKSDFWYIHVLDTFLTSNCAYYFPVELFASKYYAAEDIVGDLKYSCTILTYFYLVEQY